MIINKRSKILATTFICGLAFAMSGCAGIEKHVDIEDWDVQPDLTAQGDMKQVEPILRVAHATRARGDYVTAAALYRRAHELAPKLSQPLMHLGFTLSEAGAPAQAEAAFRQILQRQPRHAEALRGLGLALLQSQQPQFALEHLQAALAIGEDVRVYNAMGVAYDMVGDHVGAQTHYYLGLEVEPSNLSLRSNLGLSLALTGDYERAMTILDSVARSPQATPEHRQTLDLAYALVDEAGGTASVGSQTGGLVPAIPVPSGS